MLLRKISTLGSKMFKNVCLGGTFDGIHSGHKLLFGEAIKVCTSKLVVGVTDSNMIKSKILWELIAPVEERIEKVTQVLKSMNSELTYEVVPIHELYGPTITQEDLECIVVSEETIKGSRLINEARKEKGWQELEVHVVRLIQETSLNEDMMNMLHEKKISSSLMRVEKLGTILKTPKPNNSIPPSPYMIGLTGGIASGKTGIGKYLESLGFGYINYDILGHKTYSTIGSPIYRQIVDYFGQSILDETSKAIDRGKLGKLVFADGAKRKKLEEIVWPGIYALADSEVEKLKNNHDVIVHENALLIESGRTDRVHQVWTAIVPPEEAVRRQMESRGSSREEAQKKVNSQTDNLTRVKASNAVFCTLWEPEFTQKQVRKCVDELFEKFLGRNTNGGAI